jgi:hypothetical protein
MSYLKCLKGFHIKKCHKKGKEREERSSERSEEEQREVRGKEQSGARKGATYLGSKTTLKAMCNAY